MSLQLPQALLLPQVETPGAHKISWRENRLYFVRVIMMTKSCEIGEKSTRLTLDDKLDQEILEILNTYNLRHWCRWRLVKVMYHLSLDFVGSPIIFFFKVDELLQLLHLVIFSEVVQLAYIYPNSFGRPWNILPDWPTDELSANSESLESCLQDMSHKSGGT